LNFFTERVRPAFFSKEHRSRNTELHNKVRALPG